MMWNPLGMASNPTIARRALGTALRNLREAKNITRTEAGAAIGYSHQTIQRIEEGSQLTRELQVDGLCNLYGPPLHIRRELLEYARRSAQRGWWEPHKAGAPPQVRAFVETEAEMTHLRTLELEHVPALLQTDGYLRAVQQVLLPLPDDAVQAVRELRQQRQRNVFKRTGRDAPRLNFLIGRHALMYLDDLGDVGREQIEHMRKVSVMPNVTVRVLTKLHPAMLCAFTILTPGPPLPGRPFVFLEAVDGGRYEEQNDVVSLYERTFEAAQTMGTPLEEYLT